MPRKKAGAGGYGRAHHANISKNNQVTSHKKLVMKSTYKHPSQTTGLKVAYHSKGVTMGNLAGADVHGFNEGSMGNSN